MTDFVCPVCFSRRKGRSQKYRGRFSVFDKVWVIECRICGTWSAFPIISQEALGVLYEESYWTREIYERRLPYLEAQVAARCRFIQSAMQFSGELKILDVGASVGVFNRLAERCFNNCTVDYYPVEVNPAAIQFLEENCNKSHILQTLDQSPAPFQLIVLSHILEHIALPMAFLQEVGRKLTADGALFIEVPNCDLRFKRYHQPHMVFYNIRSLRQLVEQCGFRCLRIESCGRKSRQMRVEANLSSYSFIEKLQDFFSQKSALLLGRKQSANQAFVELELYGGDRRWLRLVAVRAFTKKNSSSCL